MDGQVAAGRRLLLSGEVVMLRIDGDGASGSYPSAAASGTKRGAPRMQLVCDPVCNPMDWERDSPEGGLASALAGLAKFRSYYKDLLAMGSEDWEQCERLFQSPVPLSLRLNRSPLHNDTVSALIARLGHRAEFVPWMEQHGGALHVAPTASQEEAADGLELVNMLASAGEVVVQDGLSMLPLGS